MKQSLFIYIKVFILSGMMFLFNTSLLAQKEAKSSSSKTQTAEFKVMGNCGMCEKRIEKAAMIKGVKLAEWNKETQMLKVVFNTKKANLNAIHTSVSNAGHDTELAKAPKATYKSLPACCAYRDGAKCDH